MINKKEYNVIFIVDKLPNKKSIKKGYIVQFNFDENNIEFFENLNEAILYMAAGRRATFNYSCGIVKAMIVYESHVKNIYYEKNSLVPDNEKIYNKFLKIKEKLKI